MPGDEFVALALKVRILLAMLDTRCSGSVGAEAYGLVFHCELEYCLACLLGLDRRRKLPA